MKIKKIKINTKELLYKNPRNKAFGQSYFSFKTQFFKLFQK
jgi:hypothetical protein